MDESVKPNHSKELFEELEALMGCMEVRDGTRYFNFGDRQISFNVLSKFLDLFRHPEQEALYNMINRIFVVFLGRKFEYLLDIPTIKAFSFKLIGNILTMRVETTNCGIYDEKVQLVGLSDRMYLTRLFNCLTVNAPMVQFYDADYEFSLADRSLCCEVFDTPQEN